MGVQITIRNVPEEVRDELASRAARQRKSMQKFLLEQLELLSRKPTIEAWLEAVRERKSAAKTELAMDSVLRHRDADRR